MTCEPEHGVLLPNGCRITHGDGAAVKSPFDAIPMVLHELSAARSGGEGAPFRGQFGFIPFKEGHRLLRHVHLDSKEGGQRGLVTERILVVGGVALVELNGQVLLAAPGTLVHIGPGVPHIWAGCPPGVILPDGTASNGRFLMVYEYSDKTLFFPVEGTATLDSVADYRPYAGDLEAIRFPRLDARQVARQASYVWNRETRSDLRTAA